MDFVKVMKQKKRMCVAFDEKCLSNHCPLSSINNGEDVVCNEFIMSYPMEAEKIIMDWANEHPAITNAQKFKEVFGFELPYINSDFWNREYVEK